MSRKRFNPEEIVNKLRAFDVLLAPGSVECLYAKPASLKV